MNKILALACGILISTILSAQDVDRQYVLLEKFTGTACGPCASMAGDLDKAVEDGCDFALVEYHQYRVDQYSTDFGASRANYYGVMSFPNLFFDGEFTGDMQGRDYYETIVEYYNRLRLVKSPLFIEVEKTQGATLQDWTFDVKVNRVNTEYTNTDNLKIFGIITESDIRQKWGNSGVIHKRLNHVCRYPLTDITGESVVFQNNVYEKHTSVVLDKANQVGNCEAIFFVQDIESKMVIQAIKVKLIDGEIEVVAPVISDVAQLPGTQSVMLNWTVPAENELTKVIGYNVYSSSDQKINKDGIVPTNSYITKKSLVAGQQCFYVTAVYDLLESSDSNMDCADLKLLQSPLSFDTIARGNAGNVFTLRWEAPQGYGAGTGNEQYIAGYNIYRNSDKINAELISETTYNEVVEKLGKYAYQVTAVYKNSLVSELLESPESSPIVVEVKNTLSIDDVNGELIAKVYPNPTNDGLITIEAEYQTYTISDLAGRIVVFGEYNSKINISHLNKGIYLLNLKAKAASKSIKIIKQ